MSLSILPLNLGVLCGEIHPLPQCPFSPTHKESLQDPFCPLGIVHCRWGFFHSTVPYIFGRSDECDEFHSAALSDCTSLNSPHSFIKDENPVTIETAVLHALAALSLRALPQCCYKIFSISLILWTIRSSSNSHIQTFSSIPLMKNPCFLFLSVLKDPKQ